MPKKDIEEDEISSGNGELPPQGNYERNYASNEFSRYSSGLALQDQNLRPDPFLQKQGRATSKSHSKDRNYEHELNPTS